MFTEDQERHIRAAVAERSATEVGLLVGLFSKGEYRLSTRRARCVSTPKMLRLEGIPRRIAAATLKKLDGYGVEVGSVTGVKTQRFTSTVRLAAVPTTEATVATPIAGEVGLPIKCSDVEEVD